MKLSVNDVNNQYNSIDGTALAYDAAGNLKTDNKGYMYSWDHENHLLSISKPAASGEPVMLAEFTYDALGRRVRQVVRVPDSSDSSVLSEANTIYIYNGWQLLTEVVTDANTQENFVHYAYGKRHVFNADYSRQLAASTGTNIGFTGQRVECFDNTLFEPCYYKNWWYGPGFGIFLSEDPLGVEGSFAEMYLDVRSQKGVGKCPDNPS